MSIKKITRWALSSLLIAVTVYYFLPEQKLPPTIKIDHLIVYKSKRELQAYSANKLIKTYRIALGKNPLGAKECEGDKKTPEGIYFINAKNPHSDYHKNLGISYPNKQDTENAKKIGKPTGGDIKIHALKNGRGCIGKFQRWYDWTAGCIALTNEELDELFDAVDTGTPIEIKP
jgi:murein L,D-transpeptidase YafK